MLGWVGLRQILNYSKCIVTVMYIQYDVPEKPILEINGLSTVKNITWDNLQS